MNFLLLGFALILFALLCWTFVYGGTGSARLWLLRLLLTGMCYDNVMQGLGNWFMDAPWYEGANVMRFVLHTTVLPFLTIFALAIMGDAGVVLARKPGFVAFCWLFTLLALGWGFYHEVLMLELGPKPAMGVMKLGSLSGVPPIATIATNLLVLPMAAAVWRVGGWPWFFLGALFIFVVNGATGSQPWGFISGNFAELVFIASLLLTERRFGSHMNRIYTN